MLSFYHHLQVCFSGSSLYSHWGHCQTARVCQSIASAFAPSSNAGTSLETLEAWMHWGKANQKKFLDLYPLDPFGFLNKFMVFVQEMVVAEKCLLAELTTSVLMPLPEMSLTYRKTAALG